VDELDIEGRLQDHFAVWLEIRDEDGSDVDDDDRADHLRFTDARVQTKNTRRKVRTYLATDKLARRD
jgi:hypothetical protein